MSDEITRRVFLKLAAAATSLTGLLEDAAVGSIEEIIHNPNTTDTPTDTDGPTVMLSTSQKNPIADFMYFIPLISPVWVYRETSVNNEQQVSLISYKKDEKSFEVECEFKVTGKGFHNNTFDPKKMMEWNLEDTKEGKAMTSILDYIKLEDEGFVRIEVKGDRTTKTVNEVNLYFNVRGHKSPVTIGVYDVKPEDGEYKYENRYDKKVVRVNKLMFKKNGDHPKMDIEVAHIYDKTIIGRIWSWSGGRVKDKIANWFFIDPFEVDKPGNDAMLDFGLALYNKQPKYTFPKARNLRER